LKLDPTTKSTHGAKEVRCGICVLHLERVNLQGGGGVCCILYQSRFPIESSTDITLVELLSIISVSVSGNIEVNIDKSNSIIV